MLYWLKAITVCHIQAEDGSLESVQPGFWFQAGRMAALRFEANGQAVIKNEVMRQEALDLFGCGVLYHGPKAGFENVKNAAQGLSLPVEMGPLSLPFSRTLLVGHELPKVRLTPVGFRWLAEGWHILVPFLDMDMTAGDITPARARPQLERVLRDLRLPVYNPDVVFVLRSSQAQDMIQDWADRRTELGDNLAFLMALYQARLPFYPLPVVWGGG